MSKNVINETEKEATCHAHSMLLRMADGAINTYVVMQDNVDNLTEYKKYVKIYQSDLLFIALDCSISALEAFINHIGFIIDVEWSQHEAKNFWKQYERIIKLLKSLNIDISFIESTPYKDFTSHRDIRNALHHPHASMHNKVIRKDRSKMTSKEQWGETDELLRLAGNVDFSVAQSVNDNIRSFIEILCQQFSELKPSFLLQLKEDKQNLLRRIIAQPFSYSWPMVIDK